MMRMQQKFLMSILFSVVLTVPAFAAEQAQTAGLSTDQEKLGYAFGYNIGKNFAAHQIAIDSNTFMRALKAGLAGAPSEMTPAQTQEILLQFQKNIAAKQAEALKQAGAENLKSGEAFMQTFLAGKGVHTAKIGNDTLAYQIKTAGTGAVATATDSASIVYEGRLVTGQVFDSTKRNANKPITLKVSQTIPGMQKILTMMPVGSTWQVVIPSTLAYGPQGIPGSIVGPNATLVFDLTLTAIAPTTSEVASENAPTSSTWSRFLHALHIG